ncbi:hypothetical protein H0H93_011374 [Arthromyces matolae]|nr:hypothetical protein H0H93_011374 [Arthromyces matolae]
MVFSTHFIPFDIFCIFVGAFILRKLLRRPQQSPLPPGPKGYPIIGNLLDYPSAQEWKTFQKWGQKYGDLISVNVLGQPIVIVNSAKVAHEMMDKKSHIYSDRPVLEMGGNLVGWKNTLVLLPYGDRFRRFRRLFHGVIGSRASMKQFSHVEEGETHKFLGRLLTDPTNLKAHVRHMAVAIILRISHGYNVEENNDSLVKLADTASDQFSLATVPGKYLVDTLPILRHIPSWFPGATFKRNAKEWAAILLEMVERPHSLVKREMAAGLAPLSFTSKLMNGDNVDTEEEFAIKWSAASLYAGGADPSVAAVHSFFLAMALHPEAAKKAQEEIDRVIGNDRLPTYEDRPHLPYVEALASEVLRWHAVAPIGVVHRCSEDDIHDGYLIPKGALIITNIWNMLNDPNVYPEPEVFNPDRYIATASKPAAVDPRTICFGFARRTCPGMHLADASVWISCAMTLAAFDISKATEDGVVIEPVHGNTNGTIRHVHFINLGHLVLTPSSHPTPFECTIKPRSQKAVSLIQVESHN